MSSTNKLATGTKITSVIIGAFFTGIMWHCRGQHGFGSSWGLFSVGAVLTMLIFAFYGNRRKMKFELIPLGAILMGATVTGWGTVNSQMSGLLSSQVPFSGNAEVSYTEISPYTGLMMMLIMGFTLIPLFSFFTGSLFSKREYKIYHYIIAVAVFFGVSYLMRATLSHYILNAIHPKAVEAFSLGLKDAGKDLTPMKAYLEHFSNMSWAKKIPYGRNYFMSIENISNAIAAIAVSLTALIAFKDKLTCLVSFGINIFAAISTTVADIFLVIDESTGLFASVTPPSWLVGGSWSLWEFGTGFGIGLFTMLIIAVLPKEISAGNKFRGESLFENKIIRFIYNFAAFTFVFGVVPGRVLGLRIFEIFEDAGKIKDGDLPGTIVCAVCGVAFAVYAFITFKKNILDKNMSIPFKMKPFEFANKALTAYLPFCVAAYFLLGSLPVKDIFSSASLITDRVVAFVMLISFIVSYPLYLIGKKHLTKTR